MRIRATFANQPVAISAAFKAVLAALVLLHVVSLDGEQVAGLSVAFDALLALFVWPNVTPVARAEAKADAAAEHARNATLAEVASLAPVKPPAKKAPAKKAPARR